MGMTALQIKKKLRIEDFRYITENKLEDLVSLIPHCHPDVSATILEQLPNPTEFTKRVLEKFDVALEHNKDSVNQVYQMYGGVIDSLRELAKDDAVPSEDKRFYVEKEIELLRELAKIDKRNKRFFLGMLAIVGLAVAAVATALSKGGSEEAGFLLGGDSDDNLIIDLSDDDTIDY